MPMLLADVSDMRIRSKRRTPVSDFRCLIHVVVGDHHVDLLAGNSACPARLSINGSEKSEAEVTAVSENDRPFD